MKIWLLFLSVLATVAQAELTWNQQVGDGAGGVHRVGRKLTSSHAGDFTLVDISGTISTDAKFIGAAAASNGKIVFAPRSANGVGVFDPTDNSFALVDISSTISTSNKFHGAAAASNGKVIFAPFNAGGVGVFDPTDNSFTLVDISGTISTSLKFAGATTASNGKIVFEPLNAGGVGVFDPTDNSFTLVDISGTISTSLKFTGAAAASNGKIVFAPRSANGVGVFDPTDNSFALVDISSTISTSNKFLGAVAASNGKIIFAPFNAGGVGVFDPTDNSFTLVDISGTISMDAKFIGAATASNGKVIFAPSNAGGVGVFDPTVNSFTLVDISGTISMDAKFIGAATASNGKIIFAPSNADGVGMFAPTYFPCDASTAPTNGAVGDCVSSLASGSSCQPTCDEGYIVSGLSSCSLGTLTTATCDPAPCDTSEIGPHCSSLFVNMTADDYPWEIAWKVLGPSGRDVPDGDGGSSSKTVTLCEDGDHQFVISDGANDGICCGYGIGNYSLHLDGVLVYDSDGQYGGGETVDFNVDTSSAPENGGVGDCPSSLPSGSTCQPTCDEGYIVSGLSSCSLGTLTTATCRRLTCCENTFVKFGFGVQHTYEEL